MIMKFNYRYVSPKKPLNKLSNADSITKEYDSKESANNLFVYFGSEFNKHGFAFTNDSLRKELVKEGKKHDIIIITDYLGYEEPGLFQTNKQLVRKSPLNYTTVMNFLLEYLPESNFYAMGLEKGEKNSLIHKNNSRIKIINTHPELENIISEIKPVISICFDINANIGLNDLIRSVELLKEEKEIINVNILGYSKYVQNHELKIMENFHKAVVSEKLILV